MNASSIHTLFKICCVGEGCVILYALQGDIRTKNKLCRQLADSLFSLSRSPSWLLDIVPSYDSVTVHFDAVEADQHDVYQLISHIDFSTKLSNSEEHLCLPICYSLPWENDVSEMMERTGLSQSELKTLHSRSIYQVYAIGFAPGFAYMGFVDDKLKLARKSTPRKRVQKGAVAIADTQLAIYPADSPGGWNILGYCPIDLLTLKHTAICPFSVGMSVTFKEIDEDKFHSLNGVPWYEYRA